MSRDLDAVTDQTRTDAPAPARIGARVLSEAIGTGLLVAAVIGSGIAANGSHPTTSGCSCWRTPSPPAARWSR